MFVALLLAAAAVQADPLQSAFAAAHRDYLARLTDKFAEATADPGLIGKSFKFVRPLSDGDSSGETAGAYYTYKDGKLLLLFGPDEKYAGPGIIQGPKYMVGMIGGKRTLTRSYLGSNAYGATRRVEVVRLDQDGLAMLARPQGEESPYALEFRKADPPNLAALMPPLPKDTYWLELPLPGSEARKVAGDTAIVIEGTIVALDGGKVNLCKSNYIAPEVTAPTEIYGSECWIGANVTRIAFVRRSSGEVLKEWVK
jgi:hypothetical protein